MNFEDFVKRATSASDRVSKEIEFPVPNGSAPFKVRLWVLSDEETTQAVITAEAWVEEQIKGRVISSDSRQLLLDTEEDRQLLARALRNHAMPDMPLADVATLRRVLNKEARSVLMQHYIAWTDECSPLRRLDDLPMEEQLAKLRNFYESGVLSDWLSSCDFVSLKGFVLLLADRLFQPAKPNS